MKKTTILMLVLILSTAIVYAAVFEIENESEKVLVTMVNQEPDPVAPGNVVEVRFRIENFKSETLKNVEAKIDEKFPFSIYSGDKIKKIGTLAPKQVDETGVIVKFKVLVSPEAAEGENDVEFRYRLDGGAWIKAYDFTIDVSEADAVLAINEITMNPEKISPGSEAKVKFKLENLAGSVLKDIKLNLELRTATATTTGLSVTEQPFTPVGSGNEKTIRSIRPLESKEIEFDLFVDADAESKMYKIPYILTYSDETGTSFSREGIVGLMVDAEPDISITLDETTILKAGTRGTVDIKFVNKGFSDVKLVNLRLVETQDYDILSNSEVYIGNVDSDDFESAEYELLMSNSVGGEVKLPLKLEYKSANGKSYGKEISIVLNLPTAEELKRRNSNGSNSGVGIIIVIVIVAAGILVWRWRKKKKKQKQFNK